MDAYANDVSSYLLAQSWQIALLAVIAGLISFALRNRSAHIRYLLWLVVLAKCLVPPVYFIPVAVLPERPVTAHLTQPESAEAPANNSGGTDAGESVTVKEVPEPRQVKLALPTAVETIVLVWSAGVFLFLLWVGTRAVRYTLWLRHRRTPLPPARVEAFQELLAGFKFRKPPKVWLAKDIGQTLVWGLFRGSVYLPSDFGPPHRAVLAHELGHIARFDAAINMLQVVAQAIYWFHPFVWWMNRKIRQEREKCCDEMAVVQLSAPPEHYTAAIVDALAAERRSAHPIPSLAIVGSVKDIEERLKTILRPGRRFYKRPSLLAAAVVILTALVSVPTALVLTARAETEAAAEGTATLLHSAASGDDIELVKSLISEGADVRARDEYSRTPLHVAANVGRREVAELLLAEGADVNAKDEHGSTPLYGAAATGREDMTEFLIARGADANIRNDYGNTTADYAMMVPNEHIAELLTAKGADASLHTAAKLGALAKVESLVDAGADVDAIDRSSRTALHYAAKRGHKDVVSLLVVSGADVNFKDKDGKTPAGLALQGNHEEVLDLLIANGADVPSLHLAAYKGDIRNIERLVQNGSDIDEKDAFGATPLFYAAMSGNKDVAEFLVSRGADVNARDKSGSVPLHPAASGGHKEVVQFLIAKGVDVNARTGRGWTPLARAADSGHADVAEILIDAGADVNSQCDNGETPLIWASWAGHTDVAGLLLRKGADIHAQSYYGNTALHRAVFGNRADTVVFLLRNGADVNAEEARGITPLFYAAGRGYSSVADVLIAAGADINARTSGGRTPLGSALWNGQKEMVEQLRIHGAEE